MTAQDDYIPGGVLASGLVNQAILSVLVASKLVARDKLLEALEGALLSVEGMQAEGEAKRDPFQISTARGARLHINMLIVALRTAHPPA
jgi:hypothetical protein